MFRVRTKTVGQRGLHPFLPLTLQYHKRNIASGTADKIKRVEKDGKERSGRTSISTQFADDHYYA
jgi:hypothetical protein